MRQAEIPIRTRERARRFNLATSDPRKTSLVYIPLSEPKLAAVSSGAQRRNKGVYGERSIPDVYQIRIIKGKKGGQKLKTEGI
jgi:hypothetical protein